MLNDQPKFITTCEEDENGDLVLNFPDELLQAMGWGEGTNLDISALPGTIVLREVQATHPSETGSPVEGECPAD